MTKRYRMTSIGELDRIPVAHGLEWRPIRRALGLRAFGANAYTAENVGDRVVEEHDESRLGHEEVYVVLQGRARFELDGQEVDAPAGTVVHVSDPAVRRLARSEEEGTIVLAVGAAPGEAFVPSAWEWYFEAYQQEPAAGIATMEAGIADLGETAPLLYHLACMEARAGRAEDARGHIVRALELDPALAAQAAEDPDLEGLL